MREREIITALRQRLTSSPRQQNAPFSSDAEIVEVSGAHLAITIDDYSAEDLLPEKDAELLGWNLVTATVSDLLAVGACPEFMLNSLVVAPGTDRSYLAALSAGMQSALEVCGARMLGGDTGSGEAWRFTGVALGSFVAGQRPISRISTARSGVVMATGCFGDANLAAGGGGPPVRLEPRVTESAALSAVHSADPADPGVACIDTSDGLVRALETLGELNAKLSLTIDLKAISYAEGVTQAAAKLGIVPEVFLMGSAGEYELLALVPESAAEPLAEEGGMRPIGSFTTGGEPGLFYRRGARRIAHAALPDPRAADTLAAYRRQLIDLARALFGAERSS
jgi:thiamine monophosphate kinase